MTKTNKIILYFIGTLISGGLSFYAFMSAVFYSWMNANGSWTAEKAAPWAYSSLVLSVIFFIVFVYFIVKIVKTRKSTNAT